MVHYFYLSGAIEAFLNHVLNIVILYSIRLAPSINVTLYMLYFSLWHFWFLEDTQKIICDLPIKKVEYPFAIQCCPCPLHHCSFRMPFYDIYAIRLGYERDRVFQNRK